VLISIAVHFASVLACTLRCQPAGAMSSTTNPSPSHPSRRDCVDPLDHARRRSGIGTAASRCARRHLGRVLHQHPEPLGACRQIPSPRPPPESLVLIGRPIGECRHSRPPIGADTHKSNVPRGSSRRNRVGGTKTPPAITDVLLGRVSHSPCRQHPWRHRPMPMHAVLQWTTTSRPAGM